MHAQAYLSKITADYNIPPWYNEVPTVIAMKCSSEFSNYPWQKIFTHG